jgi:phosphoribosylformimino-5-aminoimidazole carboxamide ribotide isomerase
MITIIPAIDIIDGQCVRLTRGNYDTKKVYHDDPVEIALQYEQAGIRRLHLVDLDGAKNKKITNGHVLKTIATRTNLWIDFGGGIQSETDIETAFSLGARQITAGSIAVKNQTMVCRWTEKYGAEKIILGADVIDHRIAIHGWQEQSAVDLFDFLALYRKKGLFHIICTDVSKDGMLSGPAFTLYQEIKAFWPQSFLIASGGISCIDDVRRLNELSIDGVIIGKALYEGNIRLEELKEFLC